MTPVELGYMIRGLSADRGMAADTLATLVSRAVLASQPDRPAQTRVPSMLPFKVRSFCAHNVALHEHCDACALSGATDGLRVFSFIMPVTTKHVYIAKGETDVGTDRGGGGTGADVGMVTVDCARST